MKKLLCEKKFFVIFFYSFNRGSESHSSSLQNLSSDFQIIYLKCPTQMLIQLGSVRLPDTGRMVTKPRLSCLVKLEGFTCSCRPYQIILTSPTSLIIPLLLLLYPQKRNHLRSFAANSVAGRRRLLKLKKLLLVQLMKLLKNILNIRLQMKPKWLKSIQIL